MKEERRGKKKDGRREFAERRKRLLQEIDNLGREYFGSDEWEWILTVSGKLSWYTVLRKKRRLTLIDLHMLEDLKEELERRLEGV